MGGGVSRRKQAKGGSASTAQTALDGTGVLSSSVRRRRRLLFGREAKRKFEDTPPEEQFFAHQEEEDDVVFERLGPAAVNDFRTKANGLREPNGFLPERAIELLELNLGTGGKLSRRLFDVGQVQWVVTKPVANPQGGFPVTSVPSVPGTRKEKMLTCYELLAIYSVIRRGTNEELLELLFCVFDVDGDDRLCLRDLEHVIEPFLALSGAKDGLTGVDLADYDRLILGKTKERAVRKIAENALDKYGSFDVDDDVTKDGSHHAHGPTAGQAAAATAGGVTEGPGGATSSQQESNPKAAGAGLSSDEDDDESDQGKAPSLGQASTEAAVEAGPDPSPQAKPKRSFFGCGSKKQASEPKEPKSARSESPTQKTKAGPKKAQRKKSSLCGRKPKKGPSVLGFQQFRQWLLESQMLPAELVASIVAEQPVPPRGAGVGLITTSTSGYPASSPPAPDVVSQPQAPLLAHGPISQGQVLSVRRPEEDDSESDKSDDIRPARPT